MPDVKKIVKIAWMPVVAFCLDVFVFDSFIMTIVMILSMVFFMAPRLIYFLVKKNGKVKGYIRMMILFVCAIIAIYFARYLNSDLAESRANKLIIAVEKYKETEKAYPDKLEQLVPKYIPSIPSAKIGIMSNNSFGYTGNTDSPFLYYYVLPPFGRRLYYFETKQWGFLD